jgi:hypothetical protein
VVNEHKRHADDAIAATLKRQAGVVSLRQLEAAGVTAATVRARVRAERWQRCARGVYATFTGELSWLQRVWVALLACGPTAAATGATAMRLYGLQGAAAESPCISISVEHSHQVRPPGQTLVTRRRDGARWVHPVLSPPRVRLEHAALEWASAQTQDAAAIAVLADVVQQRRTTPARLRLTLEERQCLPHRSLLLGVVADVDEGAYSLLEVRYLRDVERPHRLPRGRRQQAAGDDRRYYRDVAYDRFGTLVELDGRLGHEVALDRWADMDRDNAAAASALLTLRLSYGQVVGDPCRTAGVVGQVLARRGWAGRPVRCGASCQLPSHWGVGAV